MEYAREGFRAFAQDLVFPSLCSSFFKKLPLLYFLALRGGTTTKDQMTIGRPGSAALFTGIPNMDKAKQEELTGANAIFVNVHTATTDYTKRMGVKDSRPTITSPETNSQDNNYAQAEFRRHRKVTPIQVWHSSLKRAKRDNRASPKGFDNAVKNIVRNSTDEGVNVHEDHWAWDFWNGGTSALGRDGASLVVNQNRDMWNAPLGIVAACASDNVYARVNRANSGSTQWRGKRVTTTMAADVYELIDEANLGQGCAETGDGITLGLTTAALFRKFKRQARKEGHHVQYWADGVPEMAQLGFQREIIRVDNTWITWDPYCPAGYFAGLNLYTWFFSADADDNFTVSNFESMCDNGQSGGVEADQAFVTTEAILGCHAPYANCLFTDVQ